MGQCLSNDPDAKHNAEIDNQLKKDKEWLLDEIKLLLLGTGESGKSTVFKQFKILQENGGFKNEELISYKRIILSNCINQMKVLISAAAKLGIEIEKPENQAAAQKVVAMDGFSHWNAETARMIGSLWQDPGIRKTYESRNQFFQLDDSASYLFENTGRFADPNYEPSTQDVLRARSRTTGIEEALFHFKDLDFRLIDVGGQRSERRKWIRCFDCVTCVIFCISLSEYDQVLREDPSQNRTRESLLLFDEICNSPWFGRTPFIVFFNKIDLFMEKAKKVPLKVCFPEYSGGNDPEAAKQFLAKKFLELNTTPGHRLFHHFTCAIDPSQMMVVFGAVRKTMIEDVLKNINVL